MFGQPRNNELEIQRVAALYGFMEELIALQQAQVEAETIRRKIEQMLEHSPSDGAARLFAANIYLRLGDTAAAITQCAIGLALDPNFYALHHYLGILLKKQGNRAEAERVLEAGWQYCQKQLPRRLHAEERAKFFSVLDKY